MKLNLYLVIVIISFLFTGCSKNKKVSCNDGIKNQGEILTDCGGPCSPCETCSDGILNQDETATDCGGVCSKCGTCYDGIQNQGEAGVDCGGPCVPCNEKIFYYSEIGTYGYNLLHDDTVKVVIGVPMSASPANANEFYSIRSQVPQDVKLKVVIKRISGNGLWWITSFTNWKNTTSDNNNVTTFEIIGKVTADAGIVFRDHGTAILQIFEGNATTATREKTYIW